MSHARLLLRNETPASQSQHFLMFVSFKAFTNRTSGTLLRCYANRPALCSLLPWIKKKKKKWLLFLIGEVTQLTGVLRRPIQWGLPMSLWLPSACTPPPRRLSQPTRSGTPRGLRSALSCPSHTQTSLMCYLATKGLTSLLSFLQMTDQFCAAFHETHLPNSYK